MHTIIDREYVRGHAGEVIREFGLMAYLRALRSPAKGLLEQVAAKYLESGMPMPGRIGNAYRLSAILEWRAARIYGQLARRFDTSPLVHAFFESLRDEEEEHGRIMLLCLYTIDVRTPPEYVPSVRDPEILGLLRELRGIERNCWKLSLDEALALTEQLETSEINLIFDRLLHQARSPQSDFFVAQLVKVEGHAAAVPKRIKALREKLVAA
jgi:rubrerythrin